VSAPFPYEALAEVAEWFRAVAREEAEAVLARLAPDPAWLPLEEAARRLGRSRDATRMLANRGALERRTFAGRLEISTASIERRDHLP
jgi:hypothetical protein